MKTTVHAAAVRICPIQHGIKRDFPSKCVYCTNGVQKHDGAMGKFVAAQSMVRNTSMLFITHGFYIHLCFCAWHKRRVAITVSQGPDAPHIFCSAKRCKLVCYCLRVARDKAYQSMQCEITRQWGHRMQGL